MGGATGGRVGGATGGSVGGATGGSVGGATGGSLGMREGAFDGFCLQEYRVGKMLVDSRQSQRMPSSHSWRTLNAAISKTHLRWLTSRWWRCRSGSRRRS